MPKVYRRILAPGAHLIVQRVYIIGHSESADAMSSHMHDCLEVVFVRCPLCRFYLGEEVYLLHQDDLVIYDSTRPHRIEWVEDALRPLLGVAIACVPKGNDRSLACAEMLRTSPGVRDFFAHFSDICILRGAQALLPTLQGLASEMLGGGNTGYETILLNRLFIDICSMSQREQSASRIYVERICAYIEENYATLRHIEEIAGMLGLHKSHMQRLFKAQTSRTIWQYLQGVRMRHAERLLRESKLSIGEVAAAVGVHSRQNFYTLFQKAFGVSPRQYRRQSMDEGIAFSPIKW